MSTNNSKKTSLKTQEPAAKKPAASKKKNMNTADSAAPAAASTEKTAEGAPAAETNSRPRLAIVDHVVTGKIEVLKLADVKASAKTQVRVKLNDEALEDYTEAAKSWKEKGADSEFPPLVIYRDEAGHNWLGDGFTRRAALKAAGFTEHPCEIREGTMEDAFFYGCRINSAHGAKLTHKDKKNALIIALDNKEIVKLSNNEIANRMGVSESFVRTHRPKNKTPEFVEVKGKGGKTRKVSTKKTPKKGKGKGKAADASAAPAGAAATSGDGVEDIPETGAPATSAPAGASPNADQQQAEAGKKDDEADRKLGKIVILCNAIRPGWGDSIRKAINDGTLPMSNKAIKDWAQTSDARIQKAAPLIVENKWTPKQAFAFLDKVPDANTKMDHFINLAVSGGGFVSEIIDGYRVIVFQGDKFDYTRNIPNNTHRIAPKGAAPEVEEDAASAGPEKPENRVVELDEQAQAPAGE